jgi:hypothetical protein
LFDAALADAELARAVVCGNAVADPTTEAGAGTGDEATGAKTADGPRDAHPASRQAANATPTEALTPFRRTRASFGFSAMPPTS